MKNDFWDGITLGLSVAALAIVAYVYGRIHQMESTTRLLEEARDIVRNRANETAASTPQRDEPKPAPDRENVTERGS